MLSDIMASFRRFRPDDLDKFSKCNLDPLTETYDLSFYLQYFAKWPTLFQVAEDPSGNIIGYSRSTSLDISRLFRAIPPNELAFHQQSWEN